MKQFIPRLHIAGRSVFIKFNWHYYQLPVLVEKLIFFLLTPIRYLEKKREILLDLRPLNEIDKLDFGTFPNLKIWQKGDELIHPNGDKEIYDGSSFQYSKNVTPKHQK